MAMQTSTLEVSEEGDSIEQAAEVAGRSPMRIAMARLRTDWLAMTCLTVIAILILLGLFAPLICKAWHIYPDYRTGAPTQSEMLDQDSNPLAPGSCYGLPVVGPPCHGFTIKHPLGIAPQTGYDNLARLLYGLRTSLGISLVATIVSMVVGIGIGLVAGFSSGWVDRIISFFIDLFLSFPFILGALVLAPIITSRFAENASLLNKAQIVSLVSVLVIFGWMGMARLIRGQVLSLREREFIQAARVIGVPTRRILLKELLPNLVAPIVVMVSLTLPGYVAAEAALSYLGIGLTGVPSLGQTINSAVMQQAYNNYPLFLWVPVATVMVLVLALNLLGDAIRDAFDPKTRR